MKYKKMRFFKVDAVRRATQTKKRNSYFPQKAARRATQTKKGNRDVSKKAARRATQTKTANHVLRPVINLRCGSKKFQVWTLDTCKTRGHLNRWPYCNSNAAQKVKFPKECMDSLAAVQTL